MPIMRRLVVTLACAMLPGLFSASPATAQNRVDLSPNTGLPNGQSNDIGVQQIPVQTQTPPSVPKPIEQVGGDEKRPTSISQLPADAEIAPAGPDPESGLEAITGRSPRADLYDEVASVWLVIRRRGQQPTPELIAREIGPDMLAKFLSSFPGSEKMFGIDSDTLPINPPNDAPSPPPAGH